MGKPSVTFKGTPLTLTGSPRESGDRAPECSLLGTDLSEKSLEDFRGKVVLLNVVPSLDTPVCNTQTRRFDEELGKLRDRVTGVAISADLPFAQKRWAGEAGIKQMVTLSDHRAMAFGDAYGTHIKELRLETRAVFVIDKDGIIRYAQYVPEMTDEPDYDAALKVVRELAGEE